MTAKKKAARKSAAKQTSEPEVQVNRTANEPAPDDNQTGRDAGDQSVYEPKRLELENAGFDHHAAEEKRQAELAAEREVHNRRTGDASR